MYDGVGRRGLSFEMNKLMLFSVLAGMGSAPIMAQVPQGPVQPRPYPVMQAPRPAPQPPVSAPAQAVPQTQPQLPPGAMPPAVQATPAPAPLPPPLWDAVNAEDLLHYIQQVGAEGLNPADYDPDGLATAIRAGDYYLMSAAATQRFNQLSSDLALGHETVELGGDDRPERFGLGCDGGAREPEHPSDEAEADDERQQQAPAAGDWQIAAQEANAAVEEDREDGAADDKQQRLGQNNDADDEQRQPEPHGRLLQLPANDGIAKLRRTGPLQMWLGGRRPASHQLFLSDFPARPERRASTQLIGFHHFDVPSSEKVMNSARPPIFSHGTGPPRPPCHSGTRLSAESSRLSPISQTCSSSTGSTRRAPPS